MLRRFMTWLRQHHRQAPQTTVSVRCASPECSQLDHADKSEREAVSARLDRVEKLLDNAASAWERAKDQP